MTLNKWIKIKQDPELGEIVRIPIFIYVILIYNHLFSAIAISYKSGLKED